MSSKKPGDFDVPSVMLSKDDVMSRTPVSGGGKQADGKKKNDKPGKGSPFTSLVLILLLAAVGFLYYQLYLERQNIRTSEERLTQTLEELDQLGSQVNVRDQALSETGGDVNKRLTELDSEVRKLWAISNKKNKTDISSNKKAMAENEKTVSWLSKKLKVVEKQVKGGAKSQEKVEGQLKSITKRLVSLNSLEKKTVQLAAKVARLSAIDSKADVTALQGRIEELELSIAAIDAHRAQVNRNLDKIRQELRGLNGQAQ